MDLLAVAKVGYAAVPIAVALETVGVPVPAETTLVAAAVLAAHGGLHIQLVIGLAAAAAIAGDNAGYLLGRRFGRRLLLAPGPFARARRRIVDGGDEFFAAHGAAAVFLGRWVVIGRMAAAWLAGADRMPWRRFAVWNALGGVTWATTVGLVAYALGSAGARWLAVAGAVGVAVTLAHLAGVRLRPGAVGVAVTLAHLAGVRLRPGAVLRALRAPTRRWVVAVLVLGAAATGFAVFVLPEIAGAGAEWRRARQGNVVWLLAAGVAEVGSYAGYVVLLRMVFERQLGWRDSFLITMAGVAATRLLATAGAGGIALTSWALGRLGLPRRRVARGLVAFLVTLYAVYLAALAVVGAGLGVRLLPGGGGPLLTLLPAGLAASAIAAALLVARAPRRVESRLAALARGGGRLRRPVERLGGVLGMGAEGIAAALSLVRRRPVVLLGAIAWWAFDMAALAAAFRAFGPVPELPVLLICYLLGMLGNLLPLPGGVGGVEGGMIGALVAFGQPAGPALVAVLAYRLVSFWLPTVVGAPASVVLHRSLGHRGG